MKMDLFVLGSAGRTVHDVWLALVNSLFRGGYSSLLDKLIGDGGSWIGIVDSVG